MKVRVTACFIAVVIVLISTGGLMTSCVSRSHMVEADNDMEIYVQASCIPIELKMTGRDAGTVKENPVFPFFQFPDTFPALPDLCISDINFFYRGFGAI